MNPSSPSGTRGEDGLSKDGFRQVAAVGGGVGGADNVVSGRRALRQNVFMTRMSSNLIAAHIFFFSVR